MASQRNGGGFVLFDVLYEDGSRRSNRKVPEAVVNGLDGELGARRVIEQQDEEIAKASGRDASPISSLERVKTAKPPKGKYSF
ncbi:hypothetical protein [Roseomonas sp. BN140053]|uniref:hypothetical protein n=1 Tax=Roseomonas sp. BN140053 TaxID=3391898 RepID=UPI0039E7F1DA